MCLPTTHRSVGLNCTKSAEQSHNRAGPEDVDDAECTQ